MITRVYLAGPITNLTYNDCVGWRQEVKDRVGPHIQTYSPMRGKQRLKEIAAGSPILDCYEDNPITTAKGINMRDFNDVKRADALFVNMLGATKVSIGTVMEVAWARSMNKPVVCVMEKDNIHQHSMFNYACGYIVDTLDDGIELLNQLLGSDQEVEALDESRKAVWAEDYMLEEEACDARLLLASDTRFDNGRITTGLTPEDYNIQ